MRSNIDETKRQIESHDQTTRVEVDGDMSGAIIRAMVEDTVAPIEETIESIPNVEIRSMTHTPFGTEVEIR
jgi:hypothetical protein